MKRVFLFVIAWLVLSVTLAPAQDYLDDNKYSRNRSLTALVKGYSTGMSSFLLYTNHAQLDSTFYLGGTTGRWAIVASGDTVFVRFRVYNATTETYTWTTSRQSGSITMLDGFPISTAMGAVIDSVHVYRPSTSVKVLGWAVDHE